MRQVAALLVSRQYRQWRKTIASLTLDPDALPRPLPAPSQRDFMICGSPRSGTALLTAMLFQPPRIVTVMEPWDAMRLPPQQLFLSLRQELAGGTLSSGRLDLPALRAHGAVSWCRDGELTNSVEARDDYLLGIKFPAFWRYLDLLPDTKFLVCLRDPAEVVSSFRRVGGRLREGLDYDIPFNQSMNAELLRATDDRAVRRVLLYDYINERILPHLGRANVLAVRYERWFGERTQVLQEIGAFLGLDASRALPVLRPRDSSEFDADETRHALRLSRTAEALGYAAGMPT